MWAWLRDSSLVSGQLPAVITVAGLAGMGVLLARTERRWWLWRVPTALAVGGLASWLFDLTKPFPDVLPVRVLAWIAVAVSGLVLAVGQLRPARGWWRPALVLPALLLVLGTAAVKVNAVYQYRPTLGSVLGMPVADEVPFNVVPPREQLVPAFGDVPLIQRWQPPPGMPSSGKVAQVVIPATSSGFRARPGWVYLPPAYLASRRPLLPVLVLVAGQPGWPSDWLTAGHLAEVMDRFAADHAGLAPVVIVPDATGSALGNPLCMDSLLGRVQTYLTADLADWVATHLQVNTDHRRWAVGGFSYGGTCALQLAVNAPGDYRTFLDISGDDEPSLGGRARTVAAAFGGDEAAFRKVNPLDVLAHSQLPATAGRLVLGRRDTGAEAEAQRVMTSALRAGIDVQLSTVAGAHTWSAAVAGLTGQLAWLAERLGLTGGSASAGRTSHVVRRAARRRLG